MKEKTLRLSITSRTGNFNFMNPQEQSVSCHIAVFENDVKKLSTNITINYEENPLVAYSETAIELLEECIKKMFIDTSRKEKEKLLKFIKQNYKEIDRGSILYYLNDLKDKKRKLNLEIKRIKALLGLLKI